MMKPGPCPLLADEKHGCRTCVTAAKSAILVGRSWLSLQSEQTYLKWRSDGHKWSDVETSLPKSLHIQEGRLGFGVWRDV